jgi:diguanylate cyclase (GGDEF)-like protein
MREYRFPDSHILAISGAGLCVTTLLFVGIRHLEYDHMRAEFERRAMIRAGIIHEGLNEAERDLSAVNLLLSTVGSVSPEQFDSFVRPILKRNPSIQNFTFYRIVSASELPAFEADMQLKYPGFAVTDMIDGKHVPVKESSTYRIVQYVQPLRGNEAVIGSNATSQKEQGDAIERACRTGLAAMTKQYQLASQNSSQRGFVMLLPVYRNAIQLRDGEDRCRSVAGFTAAAINGRALVEYSLAKNNLARAPGFEMEVYLGDSVNKENLVFLNQAYGTETLQPLTVAQRFLYDRQSAYSMSFDAAGQPWHIVVSAVSPSVFKGHLASMLTLIGGLLLTLLATIYARAVSRHARRIKWLIERRTNELRRMRELLVANRSLDAERSNLLTLFRQAPGFIAVMRDKNHVFEIANLAYYALVGKRDLVGKPVREALPELEGQGFFELLDGVYASGEPYVGRGVPIEVRDGVAGNAEMHYVDFVYQPIMDETGAVTGIFVQGSDVSQEKFSQDRLQYMATHDALTDLPNFTLLLDRLNQAILRAKFTEHPIVISVIDLDRFKFINESLGHRIADTILKTIAGRLRDIVEGDTTVARTDGDKFVILFAEHIPCDAYAAIAQNIIATVGSAINADDQQIFLTCSVGIATYPIDAIAPDALLQCADVAMHRAKRLGGNSYQFYAPSMNVHNLERLKTLTALRNAMERSELVLHYQPQVSLTTGKIVGLEALIRWQRPDFGLVPPSEFIELAEETGLIASIGTWVLRTACAQVKAWHDAGLGELRVAVNLSPRQFSQSGLVEDIGQILSQTGLPPYCLDIELTESAVMVDVDHAIEVLGQLKRLCVQLSIDDFGTGYSSLSYLKRFPIDVLKIDRSFIKDIPSDTNDAAISDAIISMAHSLGIKVIAEGVETDAQCEFLANNMCDEIQGYLVSQPLASNEMETLLREDRTLPKHLLRLHKPARTLLLVDDEPSILSALKRQLRGMGYQILTATSGKAGLELLAQHEVDVIVSDQRMPGMTGVEFLRTVKTLYPETVRIVLSGFTELQSVTDAVNEGAIYKFLTKPWEDEQLRAHIEEAFEHKEMVNENRRLNLEVRATNQELARANRQLEDVLAQQRRQIKVGEVSLDIVREALQYVPLPVIGLDDDEVVVLANGAAQDLFRDKGSLLGSEAAQVMPELFTAIGTSDEGTKRKVTVNGKSLTAISRSMGNGTQARGRLITLLDAVLHV